MKKVLTILILIVLTVTILVLTNLIPPYFFTFHTFETLRGDTSGMYTISGQVFFKFNEEAVRSGYVKALKYDWLRDIITTVDSTGILDDGSYDLGECPPETLFIAAYADDELDFAPGFFDTTISWLKSVTIIPFSGLTNINIGINRIVKQESGTHRISGRIFKSPHNPVSALKGAVIYTKIGDKFKGYGVSDEKGQYTIDSLPPGDFQILAERIGYYSDYRLIQVGQHNTDTINFYMERVAGIKPPVEFVPEKFALYQNYPNPFNPVTRIKFDIPTPLNPPEGGKGAAVSLKIYDVLGQEVAVLVNEPLKPGAYEVEFDGTNYPSGVYFYRLTAGDKVETKKMLFIK